LTVELKLEIKDYLYNNKVRKLTNKINQSKGDNTMLYEEFILLKGYLETLSSDVFAEIPELRTIQSKVDEYLDMYEDDYLDM